VGNRSWLFRYEPDGRTRWMGLGAAADVPLARAREEAERLRVEVRQGRDPLGERQAAKAEVVKAAKSAAPMFAWCCDQYIAAHEKSWKNEKHRAQWTSTLNTYVKPVCGDMPVDQIEVSHVLKVLTHNNLWSKLPETASRLQGRVARILGYSEAMGYRSGPNPADCLSARL
jgi:hypothetical protein